MEQHAIPQQISSYEFKLIGDMTLKQFLKAAAGIVIAVMINATNLIFFLKYPLMLIFGAGGILIAFVPFQDRPLETWLLAFLRAIYSPTIYTYKKMPDKHWLELMGSKSTTTTKTDTETVEDEEIVPAKDRDRVREFIESLPSVKAGKTEEINDKRATINEEEERQIIGKIGVTDGMNKLPEREEAVEEDWRTAKVDLNLKKEQLTATGTAEFGEIPMPDKPDVPNILVGMVTDTQGKIVEGAIVEMQDEKGNPSRVLKTNSLGQFRTTAAMANGKYLIITEKDTFKFDRVNIVLEGKIVEPIRIKAII